MEHSISLEASSHSANQEVPRLLWNQKFHYWSLSWARWIQSTPSHPISL